MSEFDDEELDSAILAAIANREILTQPVLQPDLRPAVAGKRAGMHHAFNLEDSPVRTFQEILWETTNVTCSFCSIKISAGNPPIVGRCGHDMCRSCFGAMYNSGMYRGASIVPCPVDGCMLKHHSFARRGCGRPSLLSDCLSRLTQVRGMVKAEIDRATRDVADTYVRIARNKVQALEKQIKRNREVIAKLEGELEDERSKKRERQH